jgi:transposase
MKIMGVGVDLAKNVIHVHGVDLREKALWRRRLNRMSLLKVLLDKVEPRCKIGIEVCAGAYHRARTLHVHGMVVKLMASQFVKPCVKSNKNDRNDAEAICEAMAKSDPVVQHLQQLRGVGPLIATALVAAVGSGEQFANVGDFTPTTIRQNSV